MRLVDGTFSDEACLAVGGCPAKAVSRRRLACAMADFAAFFRMPARPTLPGPIASVRRIAVIPGCAHPV
ncbi:hypothetical protein [Sphingomonas desiccabilis]|uniref:Uncharacterized protein n=1 Tax=Sphingomonas desiccabilis TaxID=429134 RepID=A0A4Q2IYZ4_9SPHN|nr:hypothetical protein [Sphingomonas desiccabilis]MBB3909780.1 hypothetical protein [Sphingomonas desiccabilis]RXZ34464.1 hypothetical protein EO081_01900 [Sphingomonas desiccabilis]